jgi:hypothetical protein
MIFGAKFSGRWITRMTVTAGLPLVAALAQEAQPPLQLHLPDPPADGIPLA